MHKVICFYDWRTLLNCIDENDFIKLRATFSFGFLMGKAREWLFFRTFIWKASTLILLKSVVGKQSWTLIFSFLCWYNSQLSASVKGLSLEQHFWKQLDSKFNVNFQEGLKRKTEKNSKLLRHFRKTATLLLHFNVLHEFLDVNCGF